MVQRIRLPFIDSATAAYAAGAFAGGNFGVEAGAGRGAGALDVHYVARVELLDLEVGVGERV